MFGRPKSIDYPEPQNLTIVRPVLSGGKKFYAVVVVTVSPIFPPFERILEYFETSDEADDYLKDLNDDSTGL